MPQATSSTPNSDVIVDSADFERIRYIDPSPDPTGFTYPWMYRNVDGFYNHSYSMCLQSGCSAMFTFQGTRVAVYGYESYQVSEVQLWSSYTINGMNNVTHVSGTKQSSNTLYYQSDEMPFGEYTLFIYVGHAEDDAGYYLDWIEYNTTSTDTVSSTQTSASSTTSTQTSSTQSAADATGSLGSTNTHHGAPPIGAIAGGVVGGLILLLGALFVVYLWRRRRASMGDHIYEESLAIGKEQDLFAPVVPPSAQGSPPPTSAFSFGTTVVPDSASPNTSMDMGSSVMAEAQRAYLASLSLSSAHTPGSALPSSAGSPRSFVGDARGSPTPRSPRSVLSGEKRTYMALSGTSAMTEGRGSTTSFDEHVHGARPDVGDFPPEYAP